MHLKTSEILKLARSDPPNTALLHIIDEALQDKKLDIMVVLNLAEAREQISQLTAQE
jgi:hypothetical protein